MLGAVGKAGDAVGHADYWVTVTTIVPVLFLALVLELQSSAVRNPKRDDWVMATLTGLLFLIPLALGILVLGGFIDDASSHRKSAGAATFGFAALLAVAFLFRVIRRRPAP